MGDGVEEIMPIVMTKPKRGQEIASTPINEELYHEGYVEGIRYLVPDSNLEAMKDTINFKMRQRKSTRYKHQTSYELADYEHFQIKLNKLLTKIENVSTSSLSETSESSGYEYLKLSLISGEDERTDEENKSMGIISDIGEPEGVYHEIIGKDEDNSEVGESENELKNLGFDEERTSVINKPHSEFEDTLTSNGDNSKTEKPISETLDDAQSRDNLEPDIITKSAIKPLSEMVVISKPDKETDSQNKNTTKQSKETQQCDPLPPTEKRLRFLISGHFQEGKKPIYIIQEYEGVNSILGEQGADFVSKKSEGGTNIVIAGKFYKGNILEENNDKPAFLNTKPNKIQINPETSKIYYNFFEERFSFSSVDIVINGKFIKKHNHMTPFIGFNIKRKSVESKIHNGYSKNEQLRTILYNTGFQNNNPFPQHFNGGNPQYHEELNHQHSVNQYKTTTLFRGIIDNCYYFTRPTFVMTNQIIKLNQNKYMMKLFRFKKIHSKKTIYSKVTM